MTEYLKTYDWDSVGVSWFLLDPKLPGFSLFFAFYLPLFSFPPNTYFHRCCFPFLIPLALTDRKPFGHPEYLRRLRGELLRGFRRERICSFHSHIEAVTLGSPPNSRVANHIALGEWELGWRVIWIHCIICFDFIWVILSWKSVFSKVFVVLTLINHFDANVKAVLLCNPEDLNPEGTWNWLWRALQDSFARSLTSHLYVE